jgi:hypothetical protein
MHSTNVKIMEAECSAIMLVTMNNTTQLYILDQTNTTKFIITTAQFVTVLPNSSVTRLKVEWPRFWFLAWVADVLFSKMAILNGWPGLLLNMGSVAGSNAVGHKADNAPPPTAEWSYTSTMLYMPSWRV